MNKLVSIACNKPFRYFLTFGLIVVYYLVFSTVANLADESFFGGDEYGYQSMGVNFAYGHGIQKFGGIEKFEKYKFAKREKISGELLDFTTTNRYSFYRTPAYPIFLGIIYKMFGVHPMIAKHIQLLLLIVIAACLPLIGFYFWNSRGFLSGLIASPIYISTNYRFSEHLLTESLIAFSIFLLVVAYIYIEIKKSKLSIVILGISMGFCLLVKGSLIFIPILITFYFLYQFYRSRKKKNCGNQ